MTVKRTLKKTKKQRGGSYRYSRNASIRNPQNTNNNFSPPPIPEKNSAYVALRNDISNESIQDVLDGVNKQKAFNHQYRHNSKRNNQTILREILKNPRSVFNKKTVQYMIDHNINSEYIPDPTVKPVKYLNKE